MGIDYTSLKALGYAKSKGATFDRSATIGRQGLHIRKNTIRKALKPFSYVIPEEKLDRIATEAFAESLFTFLGAKKIDSFDFSDYEKATFIHDMNKPIEQRHKEQYDLVFDGGSLEHIFNFPVAIKNCMEMVRVGGHFLAVTMANNYNGHGFYQFSPELFFRIFSPENGYEIETIALTSGGAWYKVIDPVQVHGRVTFRNSRETYMIILAKRIAHTPIFEKTPLQSDYVENWQVETDSTNLQDKTGSRFTLKRIMRKIVHLYKRYFVTYDPKFFQKINL